MRHHLDPQRRTSSINLGQSGFVPGDQRFLIRQMPLLWEGDQA